MDIREMQCFLAIVEEGNLTKAADKTFTSPSVLSRMLNKIESRLGTALFDKKKQPWIITYAGELYAEKAKIMLGTEKEFLKNIEDITQSTKGRLVIGSMSFEEKHILPPALLAFHARYPEFTIDIKNIPPRDLEQAVLDNIVDLATIILPVTKPEIEYVPIKTFQLVLALPSDHSLAENYEYPSDKKSFPEIDLRLLADYPFILMKPMYLIRDDTENLCAKVGFKPKMALETDKLYTAHSLVAAGYGATFLLDPMNYYENATVKAAYFKIKGHELGQTIALAYKKGYAINDPQRYLLKILQEVHSK